MPEKKLLGGLAALGYPLGDLPALRDHVSPVNECSFGRLAPAAMSNQQRVDHIPLRVDVIGCDKMTDAHDQFKVQS